MEQNKRTLAKAITWQVCGLIMMCGLGYLVTGSLRAASGLSLASAGLGLITYILHERLWARIAWGQVGR